MVTDELNTRSWALLKLLIERYIRDGMPVGSKTLAEDLNISISSATIRNVMSDLEKLGYVHSPHASAGRVPTEQAYRLFVDELLTAQPLKARTSTKIQLQGGQNTSELLQSASSLLSDVTKLAGLVTIPKRNRVTFRHIEFLPLSKNRVLAILVFNNSEVQNRIIYTEREYSPSELQQAANYLNKEYAECGLMSLREKLLQSMQQDRHDMNNLMQVTLDVANQAFNEGFEQDDYVITGQTHLLEVADFSNLEHVKSLFKAFTQKQAVLHLLDKCLQSDGMQIFIGKEAGSDVFDDCSIVTAPYEADGEILGFLGVVGPKRMQYEQAISVVNITAKLLGEALS